MTTKQIQSYMQSLSDKSLIWRMAEAQTDLRLVRLDPSSGLDKEQCERACFEYMTELNRREALKEVVA